MTVLMIKPNRSRQGALVLVLAFLACLMSATRVLLHYESAEMKGTRVAESADAYVAFDESQSMWEIGGSGIRQRMRYDPAGGYRVTSLTNVQTGREWLSPGSATADLRLVLNGQVITGAESGLTLDGYETRMLPDGSLELRVSFLRGPFKIHSYYVVFPWTDVIEQWSSVENTGAAVPASLTALDSIMLAIRPSPDPLTLYWVQGLSPQIEEDAGSQPLPILRLRSRELADGVSQDLGSRARSSEDSMGWFALSVPGQREGLFGGIEWSGAWRLVANRESGQTLLRGGIQNLRHNLLPGETFVAPRRFLGFYEGDLDDAAIRSHAFARTYLMHPLPLDFPWTQYNTWYAYGIDLNEESLRREVDLAAELGLEVFYVDAGWYEGSPSQGDFGWGLGTWRENRVKFPNGLATFSNYVHSKGMRFGLWVEPERVDLRYTGAGQEIPSTWLAPAAKDSITGAEDLAPTAQICLGNRAAREWTKTWLARVVRDYHLDWLKWDNNLWMSCDPAGALGDGNYDHIQGLYEVLDFLRAEFPGLIVENCASGGNRMDYGLMRRTDIAWLSDETDPSYRVRYHMAGASYPFPPEYLNTWLVDSSLEPVDEATNPTALRAWLRSRMMGAFGISAQMGAWSPENRAVVAAEIAQFKAVRQIINSGKLYRLLPQTELTFPNLEAPSSPDAAEFFDSANNMGVVFLFQGAVPWQQRRLALKGLDSNRLYDITAADRSLSLRRTGEQLMTQGLRFRYETGYPSSLLFFKPAADQTTPEL